MDRVPADKKGNVHVPAYDALAKAAGRSITDLTYVERFRFYDIAKSAFVIVLSIIAHVMLIVLS
eukprot:scaffold8452_cov185-Ochromonas_danica.AAC.20